MFRVNKFQAIVVNYLVCVVTGLLFVGGFQPLKTVVNTPWFVYAVGLGFVFIVTFYTMALTTEKFSITVSSVASKISLAIPVLFTLFVFEIASKPFDFWNYLGLVFSVIAIILTSSSDNRGRLRKRWMVFLPLAVFILGGIIDTSINYLNYTFLSAEDEAIFPVIIFLTAGTIGTLVVVFQRKSISLITLVAGIVLGSVNYFSVYLIIKTLTTFANDGAIVFPLLNMGIILGSMLISILFFSEKLTAKKWLGIVIALAAIFLISYQELLR